MSRTPSLPKYRLHKQSGHAIVTLSDGLGGRRDVLLGPYGAAVSRREYARVIAEWEAKGRQLATGAVPVSVNELIKGFWPHVEKHDRTARKPKRRLGRNSEVD